MRVLIDAAGPLTAVEVAERSELTVNRALRALYPMRTFLGCAITKSGSMWWVRS